MVLSANGENGAAWFTSVVLQGLMPEQHHGGSRILPTDGLKEQMTALRMHDSDARRTTTSTC